MFCIEHFDFCQIDFSLLVLELVRMSDPDEDLTVEISQKFRIFPTFSRKSAKHLQRFAKKRTLRFWGLAERYVRPNGKISMFLKSWEWDLFDGEKIFWKTSLKLKKWKPNEKKMKTKWKKWNKIGKTNEKKIEKNSLRICYQIFLKDLLPNFP